MLHLYSDASLDAASGICCAATLILDDRKKTCRTFFAKSYGGVSSSSHAELLGVCQGLEWILENDPDACIEILCDDAGILDRIRTYPTVARVTNGPPASLWFRVFNILDALSKPVATHILGHQTDHNPNKTCDMLSSRIVNYLRGGGRECTQ